METPVKGDGGLKMFGDASSSRGAVAERVVASTNSVELPLLTSSNYQEWALVMKVSLEALELWDAVAATCAERAKDRRALAAILRAVPIEMKAGLAVKATAKEAWDAVKSMRVGSDRVKAASVQRLWKQFENITWRDEENAGEFAVRVTGLVGSLREMGETIAESRVVKKILRVVPRRLKQVAVAVEMFADLDTAKIEEVIGRLRVAEDADKEDALEVTEGVGRLMLQQGQVEVAGRLFLTEERWEAQRQQRGKEKACGGDARRGGNGRDARRSGGNKGDGDSDTDDDASSTVSGLSRRGWSRNRGRCFECGGRGHIAKWCRERKKKEETALLADAGEAPALL
ncbi:hypothetical protein U9M48_009154 [Paspalum notatum var. saurae]|uniref:CCHC-type domain-containing protein n=1 Tax=Paspalum notatum var. saurae TaxID=547442 RepID=A0AAQ3SR05_PASNO